VPAIHQPRRLNKTLWQVVSASSRVGPPLEVLEAEELATEEENGYAIYKVDAVRPWAAVSRAFPS
jgi:hypothetical protein